MRSRGTRRSGRTQLQPTRTQSASLLRSRTRHDPQRFYVHNVLTCHRSGHLEGVEDAEEWHRLLSKQFESAWLFWWYWFYRRLLSLMEMLPDDAPLPLPESFLESPLILTKQSGQK